MKNQCQMEFYFKRKDLEQLLKDHPGAAGIIARQQIIPRKKANGNGVENVTHISAYASDSELLQTAKKSAASVTIIDGCPYPPGCTAPND